MIDWLGEAGDTLFSLSGKWGRFLNARKMRSCFLIWIACCCYWIWRDLTLELYSQAAFCIPSIILHIYGWWYWGKDKDESK